MDKKYYWLKLKENFFEQKTIKYLRKLPDGNTLTIIYLKMLCISLKTEGIIHYDRLLSCTEEEIAMLLDEDVTLVKLTIKALIQANVVEKLDNDALFLIIILEMIGKESSSAERVRKHREKKKLLHCNTDVTENDNMETSCNIEIELELENREEPDIYSDIDKERFSEKTQQVIFLFQKCCPSYDIVSYPTPTHQKAFAEFIKNGMTIKDYETAFQKAEKSSFLKGNNKENWKAKFGWMIQYDNLTKILSGNYDDTQPSRKSKHTFNDFPQRTYNYDDLERQLLQSTYEGIKSYAENHTVPKGT